MLTQRQIDEVINASRQADDGPTQLARRIEAAVMLGVLREIEMAAPHKHPRFCLDEEGQGARNALESLADALRAMWQDQVTPRPSKS